MEPIDDRIKRAEMSWALGQRAEYSANFDLAYKHYTDAHDLILDCAKLHEKAHKQLRRINARMGHRGEWITDWLLHLFAPLGVFELVSYFAKTDALGSAICKRS